jgi:pantoate kinase
MLKNDDWKMATISFGTLSTASVITDPRKKAIINQASSKLLDELIEKPEFDLFIQSIAKFTQQVQLWSPKVRSLIDTLPTGVMGAQIMLGDGLFLFYHEEEELEEIPIDLNLIHLEKICEQTLVRLN